MGSFGTRWHQDCNADPRVEKHHRFIRRDYNANPGVEICGSTQLRESSRPGSITTSHPHPMLLEAGWLLIMAWWDRDGWLNFVFLGDGIPDGTNHHEKLGLERIWCPSQFTMPDTAGTSHDRACNNTDTRSSQPNRASCTPDFSYPLVSSTSFSSASPISLFLIHISTIIAEHTVKSSLSISPWHDHELTPSTAYTEYSIHRVQHPPKIVCLPFFLIIASWPLNVASASSVPPYTIDCRQPALYESWNVTSPCHIPRVASQLSDEESLSTGRAVHRPPPSTRPISLNHGLHVYIQTHSITASNFARSRAPSTPPNSLNHRLQVYL